jgi:hypothetical protein
LVDVVATHSQLIEQLEDERERERQLRSSLRKDEWDALKKRTRRRALRKGQGRAAGLRRVVFQPSQNLERRKEESSRDPQGEGS